MSTLWIVYSARNRVAALGLGDPLHEYEGGPPEWVLRYAAR
jgi:hypothetical protein